MKIESDLSGIFALRSYRGVFQTLPLVAAFFAVFPVTFNLRPISDQLSPLARSCFALALIR